MINFDVEIGGIGEPINVLQNLRFLHQNLSFYTFKKRGHQHFLNEILTSIFPNFNKFYLSRTINEF